MTTLIVPSEVLKKIDMNQVQTIVILKETEVHVVSVSTENIEIYINALSHEIISGSDLGTGIIGTFGNLI